MDRDHPDSATATGALEHLEDPDQLPPYELPDHVLLSGGHEVALTTGRWEDTRWFQVSATAHPAVFFDLATGTPPAPGDEHARITVILDVTASAEALREWKVDTLGVSGADRAQVTYVARPDDEPRNVLPDLPAMPILPVAMRRGPAQPMSNAPAGLRELITALVPLDPAAPSTRADEVETDPHLVRVPLTERLAYLLYQMGVGPDLLEPVAMDGLVDDVVAVIAQRFPSRTVGFGPGANTPTPDAVGADPVGADAAG